MIRTNVAVALVLTALLCAVPLRAEPPKDPDLDRLTAQLTQLDADPSLGPLGGVDRLKAHQALEVLGQTSPHSEERPPALYFAERRIMAAQFAAQADLAERQVEQLDREHDRILLEASRRDADRARMEAERLRLQTRARDEEAQRAQADQAAQQEQQASIASDESDQARVLAEARAKAADLAQQEAALTGATPPPGPTPHAAAEPRGPSMVVSGSVFVPDSAVVRKDKVAKAQLQAMLAFVHDHANAMIRIEGHADAVAGPQKSLALSQQRAEMLRTLLRANGVSSTRIQAVGLGAEQPVASSATPAGRARNNRFLIIALRASN